MSFGQKLVVGVEIGLFAFGFVGFNASHELQCLAMTSLAMIAVLAGYGLSTLKL
jgi:hypothetical protein